MENTKYFFTVEKISSEIKNEIKRYVDNDNIIYALDLIKKYQHKTPLGELREDEQFLFYSLNCKYYQPTKASVSEFITNGQRIICDDKGGIYHPNDFWKIVDETQHLETNHSRIERLSEEKRYLLDMDDFYTSKIKEFHPEYGEFFNDNLRFSSVI